MRYCSNSCANLLVTAILFCASVPAWAQVKSEGQAIRVGVNLVRIPVRVTDGSGRILRNLGADDFQVLEDGKEQKIAIFHAGTEPAHVALVIDTSRSTQRMMKALLAAAIQFAQRFAPDDQMALYEAGPEVVRVQGFTLDRNLLRRALEGVETAKGLTSSRAGRPGSIHVLKQTTRRGGTLLFDALLAVKREFPASAERRVIIVFTDGWDSGSDADFRVVHDAMLTGNEQVFALVAQDKDLLRRGVPLETQRRALTNPRKPRTWAVAIDTLLADDDALARQINIAQVFLDQLKPADRVWLFAQEGGLRPIFDPPARLAADGSLLPLTPEAARMALARLRTGGLESLPSSGATNTKLRPDSVLYISDGGVVRLRHFLTKTRINSNALARIVPELYTDELELLAAMQTLVHDPDGIVKVREQQEALQREWVAKQLPLLAADSGGQSFELSELRDVESTYWQIAEQIRSTYTIGYYTDALAGRHQLEVTVRSSEAQVRARRAVLVN